MGEKQKTEGKKEREERTMVITMAKLRMALASTHGARKPPGSISCVAQSYPEKLTTASIAVLIGTLPSFTLAAYQS